MNAGPEDGLPSTGDGRGHSPNGLALQPEGTTFFQQADWLGFVLTTAAAFCIYAATLAPEVTLEFSGIEATGAKYAAIPHPPGFVLWTLYAWVFATLLPFSNIAWRVAVSSAVAGALTAGVVALLVSRGGLMVLEGIDAFKRLPAKTEVRLRMICGFVAGLGFGLHRAFWGQAVIVEITVLGTLLFATTISLLMRWAHDPNSKRYLYWAALMYGLTLTVTLQLAAAAPGLLCLLLLRKPALGRDIFCAAAVFLCAVLVAGVAGFLPAAIGGPLQLGPLRHIYFILALGAGAIAGTLWAITRRLFTEWRTVCAIILVFGTALSLYFYTAIASMTNPPMNWSYPRTVDGFIHLISRGQYEPIYATDSFGRFVGQVGLYAIETVKDVGLIYIVSAFVPFWYFRKLRASERRWMLGLLATFLCLSLFLVALLNPAPDSSSMQHVAPYFINSHLILCVWSGFGLLLLGTKINCKAAAEPTQPSAPA